MRRHGAIWVIVHTTTMLAARSFACRLAKVYAVRTLSLVPSPAGLRADARTSHTFVPLAMESYGRLGKEAARFLGKLGDIAAQEDRVTKAAFVRTAHRRISCAIVRGNASVYEDVAARIVQAGGHAFVPGSDVVLAD